MCSSTYGEVDHQKKLGETKSLCFDVSNKNKYKIVCPYTNVASRDKDEVSNNIAQSTSHAGSVASRSRIVFFKIHNENAFGEAKITFSHMTSTWAESLRSA